MNGGEPLSEEMAAKIEPVLSNLADECTHSPRSGDCAAPHRVCWKCMEEILRSFVREILQAGNDEIARLKVMVDGEWTDCDEAWIERAGRYFEDLDSDPRKTLREKYAPGSVLADVVMHEVWKRDPAVNGLRAALLASQEREKRLAEALETVIECHTNDSDHCRFCEADATRHASGCIITALRIVLRAYHKAEKEKS